MIYLIIFLIVLIVALIVSLVFYKKSKHDSTAAESFTDKPFSSVLAGKTFAMSSLTGVCGPYDSNPGDYKFCGQFWKFGDDGISYMILTHPDDGAKGSRSPDIANYKQKWRFNLYTDLATKNNITVGVQHNIANPEALQSYTYFSDTGILAIVGPDGSTAICLDTEKAGFNFIDQNNMLYCNNKTNGIPYTEPPKDTINDITKLCN